MNIIEIPWMRIWVRGKPGGERTRRRAVMSDWRHIWNKMVKLWNAKWIISCLQYHTDILKTALWVLWDICAWLNWMSFFEWFVLRLVQWKVSYREGNKGHPKRKFNLLNFLNLSSLLSKHWHLVNEGHDNPNKLSLLEKKTWFIS